MTPPTRIPPGSSSLWRAAQQLAAQGKLDSSELAELKQWHGDAGTANETSLRALLQRHQDELDLGQHPDLATVLGKVPSPREPSLSLLQGQGPLGARQSEGPGNGPQATLTERSVLEDLLQRHGPSLDGQLRNMVVGFLRTLPDEDSAPRRGQLGALAQVIALRGDPKPFPRRLDVDPEQTPVPRQDLERMLDANASRGQLLVAMGAASESELARYQAGEMTLGEFYRLAARGHFGEAVDQPVSYPALRERMTGAGLEVDFHRLLGDLEPGQAEQLLDGQLTPRAIFTLLAQSRGRED